MGEFVRTSEKGGFEVQEYIGKWSLASAWEGKDGTVRVNWGKRQNGKDQYAIFPSVVVVPRFKGHITAFDLHDFTRPRRTLNSRFPIFAHNQFFSHFHTLHTSFVNSHFQSCQQVVFSALAMAARDFTITGKSASPSFS